MSNNPIIRIDEHVKESECPSSKGTRLTKCTKNVVKLSTSTALFLYPCSTCSKKRVLCGLKKHAPKECIKSLLEECLEDCEHFCGDNLCPKNDRTAVELPHEYWRNKKSIIEFRHSLTCASLIGVQVDSMKIDGNLIIMCYYCGSEDVDVNKRIQGCRAMCNACL